MDFAVTVEFDDDLERVIHVDDVLAVEMPFEPKIAKIAHGLQEVGRTRSRTKKLDARRNGPKAR